MVSELTPLLKAAINFAYIGGALFVAIWLVLELPPRPPAPGPADVHIRYLILLDRGPL